MSDNCSIGTFLQTDPRTGSVDRVSSSGDSLCPHFNTLTLKYIFSALREIVKTQDQGKWQNEAKIHCLMHCRWAILKT